MTKGLRIAYGLMGLGVIIVIIMFGNVVDRLQNQQQQISTQQHQVKSLSNANSDNIKNINNAVCNAFNQMNNYNIQYFTNTLKQDEASAKILNNAISGKYDLDKKSRNFLRNYIHSVLDLYKHVPTVLNTHPYKLKDLPCNNIIKMSHK